MNLLQPVLPTPPARSKFASSALENVQRQVAVALLAAVPSGDIVPFVLTLMILPQIVDGSQCTRVYSSCRCWSLLFNLEGGFEFALIRLLT